MTDQTFFLLMVRVSDKAGLRFTGTVENFKYWLFKYLAIRLMKPERCLRVNELERKLLVCFVDCLRISL